MAKGGTGPLPAAGGAAILSRLGVYPPSRRFLNIKGP